MVIQIRVITFIFFYTTIFLSAQTNQQIADKNRELDNLKSEVKRLENELAASKKSEKQSVETLTKIREQNLYLNKVINSLIISEKELEKNVDVLSDSLVRLQSNVDRLRKGYSDYVKWLYVYRQNSFIDLLFSSNSINQIILRYKYLNYVTDKNEEALNELLTSKERIENLQNKIEADIVEKEKVIGEKEQEQDLLSARKKEKELLIEGLKKNQRNLEREIDEKRKAEVLIKEIIANLIKEERERERKIREDRLKGITSPALPTYNYDSFENFRELKGSLNWPVRSGRVVRKFGENRNEKLNTVTLNYGIDINTDRDSEVYAVAEGVVSAIDWIPGYGSIIIITHKGKYRTVYGHVSDIQVSEGEIVQGGVNLGKVSESLEGSIIHFEVWEERNYQDPQTWLARK